MDLDSDAESSDEDLDEDPIVEQRALRHEGAVNRVRSMRQHPHIVATWAETGKVHIWDISDPLASMGHSVASTLPGFEPSSAITSNKGKAYVFLFLYFS